MNIWDKVAGFFGKNRADSVAVSSADRSAEALMTYQSIENVNFTAIFASKLSTLAVSEANAGVSGDGEGGEVLNRLFNEVWREAKYVTALSLGVGGVFIMPYYSGGELHTDIITQDRVLIHSVKGGKITEATVLAESMRHDGRSLARWVHYKLADRRFTITNMATADGELISLGEVAQWADIAPEITIPDTDRMLFAYLKSPADSRRAQNPYGVPITYGCDSIIKELHEHLAAIAKEYKIKQAFIGADSMLFSQDGRLPEDGVFKLFSPLGQERDFWQEFNPQIRHEPYFERLRQLFSLLEMSVGTSRGILTEISTSGATATEIKQARYDTLSVVEEIRRGWENAAADLIYAYNKILKFFGKEYFEDSFAVFDWSYSLAESTEETFAQLLEGFRAGVISAAELRQFIKPAQTLEQAEESIKLMRKEDGQCLIS